jgi:hypothetical protein
MDKEKIKLFQKLVSVSLDKTTNPDKRRAVKRYISLGIDKIFSEDLKISNNVKIFLEEALASLSYYE